MKRNAWARIFAVLVVFALMLGACRAGQPPAATQPPASPPPATEPPPTAAAPVVLRVGIAGSPDSRNPGNAWLTEAIDLMELVYDTLMYIDFAGNYHPELAESWTVSDDGLTWTFKLRDGVMFSDGTPLTAEDVAFTLLAYRDWGDFAYESLYTTHIADAQAVDELTAVVTLDAPIGNMESQLAYCYILPKHIWEPYAGDVDAAHAFENAEMIGSGPFRMVEYQQDEYYRLAANHDHYLNPPVIDEVIFQTYSNQDALVQALRAGEVHMITEMPSTVFASLQGEAGITAVHGSQRSLRDYIFNLSTPETCPVADGGICSGHPALRDVIVRRAMAHAVDKEQIIDVALLGLGTPGIGLITRAQGEWFADELLAEDYDFDIAEANRMLDEAGYLDANGDGIRECPPTMDCGDRQLDIVMLIPSDQDSGPREADLLVGWWSQIGIRMTPQVLEPDTVTARCCPAFDFDMLLWGWGPDPDPSFILSVLTSAEIPTGMSETCYNNPEYDRLFEEQGLELDHARRVEMVHQMQRMMLEDLPYIIPYYDESVQAFRSDRFTGWPVPAEGSGDILYLQDPLSLTVVQPVQ